MVGTFFVGNIFCFLQFAFAVKSDCKLISTGKKIKKCSLKKSMLNEIDLVSPSRGYLTDKYKYSIIILFFSLSVFCFCFNTDIDNS